MTTKSTKFDVTIEEAFDLGKKEGQKEILKDIQDLLNEGTSSTFLEAYVRSRLALIQNMSLNPFKTKDS